MMRRSKPNKRRSTRAFRRGHKKTHRKNFTGSWRGGIRL